MQQNLVPAVSPHPELSLSLRSGAAGTGRGLSPPPSPGPWGLALVDETVFCCSHVELEYFEVYFLYKITGSLTFPIAPFLLWKFWNHTGPFVLISFGEKKQCSFVFVVCFQPME